MNKELLNMLYRWIRLRLNSTLLEYVSDDEAMPVIVRAFDDQFRAAFGFERPEEDLDIDSECAREQWEAWGWDMLQCCEARDGEVKEWVAVAEERREVE